MPLSKEDVQRAASILESIITQLEPGVDILDEPTDSQLPGGEEVFGDLLNIQATVDVLKNPLFSALVEIRNKYEETVEKSTSHENGSQSKPDLSKETEIKLEDNPDLVPQFFQRYGIEDAEVHTNSSAVASLTREALQGDVVSPESVNPELVSTPTLSLHSTVSNQFTFPSTFAVEMSHGMSHDTGQAGRHTPKQSHDPSTTTSVKKNSSKKKSKKSSGRHLFGRKHSSSGSGSVTLADLASSPPPSAGRGVALSSGQSPVSVVDGEQLGKMVASSESSLSSMSSEPVAQSPLVKSIQQPHSTHHIKDVRDETVITNPDVCEGSASVEDVHVESGDKVPTASSDGVRGVDVEDVRVVCGASDGVRREGVEVTDGPRDVLFFMRDKTSQTELQNLIHGEHGRERREVTLVMNEGLGLGVDLVGLSSTGVFVNKLYPGGVAHQSDKLQIGDQVLEVNNQNTENMASFEVDMLLRGASPGDRMTFAVQFNPTGMREYKRIQSESVHVST